MKSNHGTDKHFSVSFGACLLYVFLAKQMTTALLHVSLRNHKSNPRLQDTQHGTTKSAPRSVQGDRLPRKSGAVSGDRFHANRLWNAVKNNFKHSTRLTVRKLILAGHASRRSGNVQSNNAEWCALRSAVWVLGGKSRSMSRRGLSQERRARPAWDNHVLTNRLKQGPSGHWELSACARSCTSPRCNHLRSANSRPMLTSIFFWAA